MTKVVVNRCYGGFGLSDRALKLYFKKKEGIVIYAYKLTKYKHDSGGMNEYKQVSGEDADEVFVSHYAINLPIIHDDDVKNSKFYWDGDIERDDPILIEVLEELGSEASSGCCAELEILELPDGIEWQIEEYDGKEWIAERHRTW